MKRKGKIYSFKELDYFLIFLTLFCTVFGIVMISSAVNSMEDGGKFLLIQSVAAGIGFVLMAIFTAINYEKVGSAWKVIYGICIFLLMLVLLVGTGEQDTGSKSWIRFGAIGIQPSEFVIIGFINRPLRRFPQAASNTYYFSGRTYYESHYPKRCPGTAAPRQIHAENRRQVR